MQNFELKKFFTFFLVLLLVILNGCASKTYKESKRNIEKNVNSLNKNSKLTHYMKP